MHYLGKENYLTYRASFMIISFVILLRMQLLELETFIVLLFSVWGILSKIEEFHLLRPSLLTLHQATLQGIAHADCVLLE